MITTSAVIMVKAVLDYKSRHNHTRALSVGINSGSLIVKARFADTVVHRNPAMEGDHCGASGINHFSHFDKLSVIITAFTPAPASLKG